MKRRRRNLRVSNFDLHAPHFFEAAVPLSGEVKGQKKCNLPFALNVREEEGREKEEEVDLSKPRGPSARQTRF